MLAKLLIAACLLATLNLSYGYINVSKFLQCNLRELNDFRSLLTSFTSRINQCEHFWLETNLRTGSFREKVSSQGLQYQVLREDLSQLLNGIVGSYQGGHIDDIRNFLSSCLQALDRKTNHPPVRNLGSVQVYPDNVDFMEQMIRKFSPLGDIGQCSHFWFATYKTVQSSRPGTMGVFDIRYMESIRNELNQLQGYNRKDIILNFVNSCIEIGRRHFTISESGYSNSRGLDHNSNGHGGGFGVDVSIHEGHFDHYGSLGQYDTNGHGGGHGSYDNHGGHSSYDNHGNHGGHGSYDNHGGHSSYDNHGNHGGHSPYDNHGSYGGHGSYDNHGNHGGNGHYNQHGNYGSNIGFGISFDQVAAEILNSLTKGLPQFIRDLQYEKDEFKMCLLLWGAIQRTIAPPNLRADYVSLAERARSQDLLDVVLHLEQKLHHDHTGHLKRCAEVLAGKEAVRVADHVGHGVSHGVGHGLSTAGLAASTVGAAIISDQLNHSIGHGQGHGSMHSTGPLGGVNFSGQMDHSLGLGARSLDGSLHSAIPVAGAIYSAAQHPGSVAGHLTEQIINQNAHLPGGALAGAALGLASGLHGAHPIQTSMNILSNEHVQLPGSAHLDIHGFGSSIGDHHHLIQQGILEGDIESRLRLLNLDYLIRTFKANHVNVYECSRLLQQVANHLNGPEMLRSRFHQSLHPIDIEIALFHLLSKWLKTQIDHTSAIAPLFNLANTCGHILSQRRLSGKGALILRNTGFGSTSFNGSANFGGQHYGHGQMHGHGNGYSHGHGHGHGYMRGRGHGHGHGGSNVISSIINEVPLLHKAKRKILGQVAKAVL